MTFVFTICPELKWGWPAGILRSYFTCFLEYVPNVCLLPDIEPKPPPPSKEHELTVTSFSSFSIFRHIMFRLSAHLQSNCLSSSSCNSPPVQVVALWSMLLTTENGETWEQALKVRLREKRYLLPQKIKMFLQHESNKVQKGKFLLLSSTVISTVYLN